MIVKKDCPKHGKNQLNKGLKSLQPTTHINIRGQHRGDSIFQVET